MNNRFNDLYFTHIFRNAMAYLDPTHVFLLGDLLSSEWIDDQEFDRRVARYRTVFDRGTRAKARPTHPPCL